MTRVVYYTAVSMNGFIADESNSLDWLFAAETGEAPNHDEFMTRVGVLVEGSTTYEWVLEESQLLEHPGKWQEFFGELPTYVFTHRDLPVPDGADVRFVGGDLDEHLDDMVRAAGGRDIWVVGGGDLAGQFFDIGALDEMQISVAPAALTGGAPLFPRTTAPGQFELIGVERYGDFAHLSYRVHPSE